MQLWHIYESSHDKHWEFWVRAAGQAENRMQKKTKQDQTASDYDKNTAYDHSDCSWQWTQGDKTRQHHKTWNYDNTTTDKNTTALVQLPHTNHDTRKRDKLDQAEITDKTPSTPLTQHKTKATMSQTEQQGREATVMAENRRHARRTWTSWENVCVNQRRSTNTTNMDQNWLEQRFGRLQKDKQK